MAINDSFILVNQTMISHYISLLFTNWRNFRPHVLSDWSEESWANHLDLSCYCFVLNFHRIENISLQMSLGPVNFSLHSYPGKALPLDGGIAIRVFEMACRCWCNYRLFRRGEEIHHSPRFIDVDRFQHWGGIFNVLPEIHNIHLALIQLLH